MIAFHLGRTRLRAWALVPLCVVLCSSLSLARQNFLVLIADDLGIDKVGYESKGPGAVGAQKIPKTPNIDALSYGGVAFRNAYAHVVCSATRAALQTGRHPGRTGIGSIVKPKDPLGWGLQTSEITLPKALALDPSVAPYATALFGKWHLGTPTVGGPLAPNLAGYDRAESTADNLRTGAASYFNFTLTVDGQDEAVTKYATSDTVNRALAWIANAPEPWLAVVSFHAPHNPWHTPPWFLHKQFLPYGKTPREEALLYYGTAVTALDTEIGRLLTGLEAWRDRTDIVFVGDNGTPRAASTAPFVPAHAKLSPYDGAVHVPLIVNGPSVVAPGRDVTGLVGVSDVFATLIELAGVDAGTFPPALTLDSISLVPYLQDPLQTSLRTTVYSELFTPLGDVSNATTHWQLIRDARYKLLRTRSPNGTVEEFYDLWLDPFETNDLLTASLSVEEQQSHANLSAEIDALLISFATD